MTEPHILDRIIKALGTTQESIGKKYGITKASVSSWKITGIPSKYCSDLEEMLSATSDPITRADMRPNDWKKWWPELSAHKINNKHVSKS